MTLSSIARGGAAAIRTVAATLTWHITGLDHWQGGAVLSPWHGDIFLGAMLLHHLRRLPDCWAVIVPEYGQSTLMAAWAEQLGLRVALVSGYEAPDARHTALRHLIPELEAGRSVILPADGHRPPGRQPRPDPCWLAAAAGAPLLPVALAAHPRIVLPTWDRKVLPLPRSHATAVVCPPLSPTASPSVLAAALDNASNAADAMLC